MHDRPSKYGIERLSSTAKWQSDMTLDPPAEVRQPRQVVYLRARLLEDSR
jgi:hypothetical protein